MRCPCGEELGKEVMKWAANSEKLFISPSQYTKEEDLAVNVLRVTRRAALDGRRNLEINIQLWTSEYVR